MTTTSHPRNCDGRYKIIGLLADAVTVNCSIHGPVTFDRCAYVFPVTEARCRGWAKPGYPSCFAHKDWL